MPLSFEERAVATVDLLVADAAGGEKANIVAIDLIFATVWRQNQKAR